MNIHGSMCRACGTAEVNEQFANSTGDGFCSGWCEQDYILSALDHVLTAPNRRYEAPAVTEGGEDRNLDNYYEAQYEGYDEV